MSDLGSTPNHRGRVHAVHEGVDVVAVEWHHGAATPLTRLAFLCNAVLCDDIVMQWSLL